MKNLKKLMSLLLALMLLTGSVTSASATDIIAEDIVQPSRILQTALVPRSDNLRDFVTDVTIRKPDGSLVGDDETLYDNTDYTFRISFKEKGHMLQFAVDENNEMTYQLPAGITYKGNTEFDAKKGNQTIGKFRISEDGTVKFTPWYYNRTTQTYSPTKQDESDLLFIEASSDAEIWLELQGTLQSSDGKQNLEFSSTVKKEFTVEHKEKLPYADVEKSNDNNTIYTDENGRHYFVTTIRATVKDGNPTSLKIHDEFNPSYVNPDGSGTFQIKQIRKGAETVLENVQPTWNMTGWPYAFDLELNAENVPGGVLEDDEYIITYRNYLNDAGENYIGTSDQWAGHNRVQTDAGGDKKESEISYTIKGKPQIVKKSSSGADPADANVINWKIEIGDGETNIAGKTITDTWSESVAATDNPKLDRIEIVDDSRTITLTGVKADGTQGTVTIPADQAAQYFRKTTDAETGKENGFTFDVPDVPEGYEKIIKCEVDYQTRATTTSGSGKFNIKNKAEYEDHRSGEATGGGGTSSVNDFDVDKSFLGEGVDTLHFKVEMVIPGGIYNTGTRIYAADWSYLNGWDWNQNRKTLELVDVSVTANDGENTQTFGEGTGLYSYQLLKPEAGLQFFFNLPEGYVASQNSYDNNRKNSIWSWENDRDVTLTIEYTVKKPAGVDGGVVYNKAYIELDDKQKADQVEAPFGKQARIDKSATLNGDGTITYTVLINGNFTAMIPTNAVFTDTFDSEHLQYESGSLQIEYLEMVSWGGSGRIGWPTYTSDSLGKNGQIQIRFDDFGKGGWAPGQADRWYDAGLAYGEYDKLTNWYQREKTIDNVSDNGVNINFGAKFYPAVRLTYKLRIKNVKPGETQVLNNTAGIENYDDASASVTYTPKLLEKSSGQLDGSTLSYTIKVNPSGMKLLSQSGSLRLVDTMNDRMTPLLQTLKVLKSNGSELEKSKWMYFYDPDKHELQLSLPDEMALTVQYDVLIRGSENESVTVTNTARLDGFDESKTDSKTLKINNASGGGGGNVYKLVLLKTAKESGSTLAGATFRMDWLHSNTGGWQMFNEFTTTADGMVEIFQSKDGGEVIYPDVLYRITEITAPEGYKAITTPIYLVITKDKTADAVRTEALTQGWLTDEAEKNALQSAQIREIVNAEMVQIPNEPYPGIEFIKVSASDHSRTLGGAEFELVSLTDDTWKRTAASNLMGAVSFPNVPAGEYRLTETKAPNGYLMPGGYWTVKIEDANGVRTVTYTAHDGAPNIRQSEGQFVLTNAEFPNLPSVGGSGTLAYSLFGLGLMAMASAAAYALTKKRRRIER